MHWVIDQTSKKVSQGCKTVEGDIFSTCQAYISSATFYNENIDKTKSHKHTQLFFVCLVELIPNPAVLRSIWPVRSKTCVCPLSAKKTRKEWLKNYPWENKMLNGKNYGAIFESLGNKWQITASYRSLLGSPQLNISVGNLFINWACVKLKTCNSSGLDSPLVNHLSIKSGKIFGLAEITRMYFKCYWNPSKFWIWWICSEPRRVLIAIICITSILRLGAMPRSLCLKKCDS